MQQMNWQLDYWLPFLLGVLIGTILGWLLTRLAKRHSAAQAQARINELESTLQASEDELVSIRRKVTDLQAELDTTSATLSQAQADAASTGLALTDKDTALADAYHRAAGLQREVEEQRRLLAAAESQTADLRSELSILTSASQEWSTKLHEARGQVVSELAQLTSAMLRAKEEDLTQAQATIADLTRQLKSLKPGAQ